MEINDEQKQTVSGWVAAGDSLAEIQRKLDSELGISMTYMETRFLVDDLNLQLQDKEEEVDEKVSDGDSSTVAEEPEVLSKESQGSGAVSVTIDQVTQPHAIVSGTVKFSDGVSSRWSLDQMGRLALDPDQPGYRPSESDVMAFQNELKSAVEKAGQ